MLYYVGYYVDFHVRKMQYNQSINVPLQHPSTFLLATTTTSIAPGCMVMLNTEKSRPSLAWNEKSIDVTPKFNVDEIKLMIDSYSISLDDKIVQIVGIEL